MLALSLVPRSLHPTPLYPFKPLPSPLRKTEVPPMSSQFTNSLNPDKLLSAGMSHTHLPLDNICVTTVAESYYQAVEFGLGFEVFYRHNQPSPSSQQVQMQGEY